jgi:hypothetical protein
VASGVLLITVVLTGCGERAAPGPDLEERLTAHAERTKPGLHALMMVLGSRHASLWFAGAAENWPLADYMLHETEELLEDIAELHPRYEGIQVAALLREMTAPALQGLEDAVEGEDGAAFIREFDRFTAACNACHAAADRGAIVMQRPTSPPLTNLRYTPLNREGSSASP